MPRVFRPYDGFFCHSRNCNPLDKNHCGYQNLKLPDAPLPQPGKNQTFRNLSKGPGKPWVLTAGA